MDNVYCMECKCLDCQEAEGLKTGFVVINLDTGYPDPKGTRVHAGFHEKPPSFDAMTAAQ